MRICYLPSDMDAPGFYRCLSPGRQLAEHGDDVFMPKRKEWSVEESAPGGGTKKRHLTAFDLDLTLPDSADLYVLQQWKERVFATEGIGRIRASGAAVSMDVDDNYINLPSYNPAFAGSHPFRHDDGTIHNREQRRSKKAKGGTKSQRRAWVKQARGLATNAQNRTHMLNAMKQCDLVTVSTPFLAEIYSPYNDNIKVIRNCVDWDIWSDIQPQCEVERERVRIGWYGAFSYRQGDLQMISRPLSRFLRDHPEVDFVTNAEAAHDYLGVPQAQRITLGEYDFFHYDENGNRDRAMVGEMTAHCDIGLVPLAMNDLNEGKSHLKGMEYNAAGIPFIASPTESYKDYWCDESANGVLAYDEDQWYEWIDCLVRDDSLRRDMGRRGRTKARKHSIQNKWGAWRDVYADLVGDEHYKTARDCISMGAIQKVSELGPLLQIVAQEQPRTIVEIGTAHGGTFWGLAQTAPDDALLISMDIPAGSPIDMRDGKDVYTGRDRDRIKHMIKKGQKLKLIDMDSQLPAARIALEHALGGRKIDLLFIDGDHRYEGVKHDYETYSQLVRPGGMIAFHDIVTHEDKRVGVHLLWSEIEDGLEFVGPETWGYTPWGGIGVVFKEG